MPTVSRPPPVSRRLHGQMDEAEAAQYTPKLVYVDRENRLTHTNESIPMQAA